MVESTITHEPLPTAAMACSATAAADRQQHHERLRRRLRSHHRTMLLLAVLAFAAAFALQLQDAESLALRGGASQIPMLCGSRAWLDVECPGCGLTRSIVALASGNVQQSRQLHPLGWLMALAIVVQIPYRLFSLWELRTRVVQRTWPIWIAYLLLALLIGNWLLGVVVAAY